MAAPGSLCPFQPPTQAGTMEALQEMVQEWWTCFGITDNAMTVLNYLISTRMQSLDTFNYQFLPELK